MDDSESYTSDESNGFTGGSATMVVDEVLPDNGSSVMTAVAVADAAVAADTEFFFDDGKLAVLRAASLSVSSIFAMVAISSVGCAFR